jgi:diacylglycerol O-acyltransferase
MSRVMTRRMDRRRPMWEYWLCEGLADGRWGLLSKLHHSLVDGVSGTDIYQLVLDPTPTPRPGVEDHWTPAPPHPFLLTADALTRLVSSPVAAGRALARSLTAPAQLLRATVGSARGTLALSGALLPVRRTTLTGTLSGSRRYVSTDLALDDIKRVGEAHGATVNDVALAVVAGGFRRLLLSRGEDPDAHALRSLVPVSTREPGQESIPDNRVSLMLPYLPVEVPSPADRLEVVHRRIRALRGKHEPEAGAGLTTLAELGAFPPVSLGMRLALRLPQRHIAAVTTNVPGPRRTLYAMGRPCVAMLPYVPIADRVRIGVAMFSYRDALTFGITGDYDTTPDLQLLADGIEASMDEMLAEADSRQRGAGASSARGTTQGHVSHQ